MLFMGGFDTFLFEIQQEEKMQSRGRCGDANVGHSAVIGIADKQAK